MYKALESNPTKKEEKKKSERTSNQSLLRQLQLNPTAELWMIEKNKVGKIWPGP
jgi:hypothetical protein